MTSTLHYLVGFNWTGIQKNNGSPSKISNKSLHDFALALLKMVLCVPMPKRDQIDVINEYRGIKSVPVAGVASCG